MRNCARVTAVLAFVLLLGMGPIYAASFEIAQAISGSQAWWINTSTNNEVNSTTISVSDTVQFYFYNQPLGVPSGPLTAIFTLNATSYSTGFEYPIPLPFPGTGFYQLGYSGFFSYTYGGKDLLSGNFVGATFTSTVGGESGTLNLASTISMQSDYLSFYGQEAGSWALSAFNPSFADTEGWPGGNSAAGTGTFSSSEKPGTNVPEPATLSLLGIGLVGVAIAARRRV